MQITDKLYQVLEDLSKHKHSSNELLSLQVQERLDRALDSYIHTLEQSYDYLSKKDELSVLKKLNRSR